MIIIIFGIAFIVCGVIMLVKIEQTAKHERTEAWITGVGLIVFGMLGVVGAIVNNTMLILTSIFPSISAFLIYVPIKVTRQRKLCNCPIVAKCVKYNRYSGGKGPDSYAPVFEYTHNGIRYERQTPVGYPLKEIQFTYQINHSYQIYINADCPEMCVDTKRLPGTHIFCFLLGIVFLVIYLWMMCGMMSGMAIELAL